MAKSALEQLNTDKSAKVVLLDKNFAGIKAGEKMYVATPKIVDTFIKQIPYGATLTAVEVRNKLADANCCDATCPVSTAIFIRITAQAAIEQMEQGKSIREITPFWRVLSSKDKVSQKLTIDPAWLDHQRALEQS